ncbi:hypothetical protein [Nakamurella sp.]|uniref:hypothetical protein n=1 Tax=Nakamurella sp. TaxID=1869182 RepID=UPI003783A611
MTHPSPTSCTSTSGQPVIGWGRSHCDRLRTGRSRAKARPASAEVQPAQEIFRATSAERQTREAS